MVQKEVAGGTGSVIAQEKSMASSLPCPSLSQIHNMLLSPSLLATSLSSSSSSFSSCLYPWIVAFSATSDEEREREEMRRRWTFLGREINCFRDND